jgi:hypothetical protein
MKSPQYFLLCIFVAFSLGCSKDDNANPPDPHGWILAGSLPEGYKIGNDNQNFHQGAQSGYLESVSDTIDGFFGTLMQFCSGDDYRGERVRMTGYIQTMAPESSSTQMWVRVDDYDLKVIADFDNMGDRPITGTRFWTKCEIVFDVPESNCVINYGMLLVSTGKAWLDDVSFEIVDSTTFKTAYYLNEPFPEGNDQLPENLPEHPLNLDFEE